MGKRTDRRAMDPDHDPLQTDQRHGPDYPLEVRSYAEGGWILPEGEQRPAFFVVLDGTVRLLKGEAVVRTLGPGDPFGMETLLLRMPAPFGARAASRCRVACYGAEALDYFLERQPRRVRLLLTSLLRQLLASSRRIVGGADDFPGEDAGVLFFRDGEAILEENEVGSEFYRLVSSERGLVVSRNGVELGRIATPGEFFGEMAGLLGMPRHATVTSAGDSSVQRFRADALDLMLHEHPELAAELIRSMAARLARTDSRLANGGPDPHGNC